MEYLRLIFLGEFLFEDWYGSYAWWGEGMWGFFYFVTGRYRKKLEKKGDNKYYMYVFLNWVFI